MGTTVGLLVESEHGFSADSLSLPTALGEALVGGDPLSAARAPLRLGSTPVQPRLVRNPHSGNDPDESEGDEGAIVEEGFHGEVRGGKGGGAHRVRYPNIRGCTAMSSV
jgi:hypothetical protein